MGARHERAAEFPRHCFGASGFAVSFSSHNGGFPAGILELASATGNRAASRAAPASCRAALSFLLQLRHSPGSAIAWPHLNLLFAISAIGLSRGFSMHTLPKRSNAALETCLLILLRNARDLELQLHQLNKLRDQVRQAELSARSASPSGR
jgi:hypothetical protein